MIRSALRSVRDPEVDVCGEARVAVKRERPASYQEQEEVGLRLTQIP